MIQSSKRIAVVLLIATFLSASSAPIIAQDAFAVRPNMTLKDIVSRGQRLEAAELGVDWVPLRSNVRRCVMSTVMKSDEATEKLDGRQADRMIPVENPATGEVITHIEDMDPSQVESLVARARRAQPGWEALGFEARGDVMYELRHWLVQNRDRVIDTAEHSKGIADCFVKFAAIGGDFNRARKRLPCLVGVAKLQHRDSQVVVRFGVVGID